jgi:hypothetical protein
MPQAKFACLSFAASPFATRFWHVLKAAALAQSSLTAMLLGIAPPSE